MAASMRICRFLRNRPFTAITTGKILSRNVRSLLKVGLLQSCVGVTVACESKAKLEEPDASTLTREYLIKSSSIASSEYTMILLTQTALALQQAEKEYNEALQAVIFLLEFKLKVLGNPSEEARIWDLILEGRNLLTKTQKKKDDLSILHSSVINLVINAAEVAYMTGGDIVATAANDRLTKVDLLIREARQKSDHSKDLLIETELKSIEVEGNYAEEHVDELEEEKLKIYLEAQKIANAKDVDDDNNNNVKEDADKKKSDEDTQDSDDLLEILDKQVESEDQAKPL